MKRSQRSAAQPAASRDVNRRRCIQRRHRRRGISLIEVLLFITIAASVMTSAMLCLDGLFRIQRQTNEALSLHGTLVCMADRMRDDVHHADHVEIVPQEEGSSAGPLLLLSRPGANMVSYQFVDGAVKRIAQREDEVAHRERYLLGKRTDVRWNAGEAPTTVVTCIVLGANVPDVPLEPCFQLELILGRAVGDEMFVSSGDAVGESP